MLHMMIFWEKCFCKGLIKTSDTRIRVNSVIKKFSIIFGCKVRWYFVKQCFLVYPSNNFDILFSEKASEGEIFFWGSLWQKTLPQNFELSKLVISGDGEKHFYLFHFWSYELKAVFFLHHINFLFLSCFWLSKFKPKSTGLQNKTDKTEYSLVALRFCTKVQKLVLFSCSQALSFLSALLFSKK